MWRFFLLAIFFAMMLVPTGTGSPLEGQSGARKRVPAGRTGGGETVAEPGMYEFSRIYAAGQRACVVVTGDHKPVVDVEIKVFDAKNNLVAQDKGSEQARDFAAVIWYPVRQESYRIAIYSYGKEYNECYIAIK